MTAWTLYDPKSGAISTRRFSGRAKTLELNKTNGLEAIEGELDSLSQRIDVDALAAGAAPADCVVDYQPPQPDDKHEWRENVVNGRPRWVKKADVLELERKDADARARLAEIDLSLVRPLLELQRDPSSDAAQKRISALEAEAAELRKDVQLTSVEIELSEKLNA